jgi:hypothetical protein
MVLSVSSNQDAIYLVSKRKMDERPMLWCVRRSRIHRNIATHLIFGQVLNLRTENSLMGCRALPALHPHYIELQRG